MNDLKYPIKYAPMLIKEYSGNDYQGESTFEPFCFVAAPCYIISETKHYTKDGGSFNDYEIVFCHKYQKKGELIEIHHNEPTYNTNNKKCTNSNCEKCVNDNIELVKEECERRNEKIFKEKLNHKLSVEYFSSEDRDTKCKEYIKVYKSRYYEKICNYQKILK